MNLYLLSLGCAKNQVDSEMMLGILSKKCDITNKPEEADLLIVNTCAFIDAAKKEAIDKILELSDYKKENAKLIVAGCLAKRYKEKLISLLPEVDRFISLDEYKDFAKIINSVTNSQFCEEDFDFINRYTLTPPYMQYVRISDGCFNRCAFCAIPLIRGNLVSRSIEDIVAEVKEAVSNGVYEINLISQDTTMYGLDLYKKISLIDLLESIIKLDGDFKIRLLYLYPDIVTDDLINLIKNNPKVMPYFDIPIQHSEDKMLKLMNRRGDKKLLLDLFSKIRKEIPNAIIRTTFIVGFPNEDEEDFKNLCEFIKKVKFDRLGAFTYSDEEGTKAHLMKNKIKKSIKQERYEKLMTIQNEIAYNLNKKYLNTILDDCFIIGYDEDSFLYKARNYAYASDDIDGVIYVASKKEHKLGDKLKVRVLDFDSYTLTGEEYE